MSPLGQSRGLWIWAALELTNTILVCTIEQED